MKIFKQTLKIEDTQTLLLPFNSKILSLQTQRGIPVIWYECEEQNSLTPFVLDTYPTGANLPENHGTYIGTYQLQDGDLVFHVYKK